MITIREAAELDLDGVVALYSQLNERHPPLVPGPDLDRAWEAILCQPGLFVYVGEIDGSLVSTVTLIVVPNLTRHATPFALIENVVTLEAHRQKGYGGALMRHAIESAWAKGCHKVMLLTGSKREETLRFYASVGLEAGVKTGFVAYRSPQ